MEMLPPAPSVGDVPDDVSTIAYDSGDDTVDYEGDGGAHRNSPAVQAHDLRALAKLIY